MTIADRAKLFAARLGDENDNENTPRESKLGVTVRKVTPEMADRLDMPAGKGVIVQDVKTGSFADDVGVGRGDMILEVKHQQVNSEEEFSQSNRDSRAAGRGVPGAVAGCWKRQDGTIFLAGTLP